MEELTKYLTEVEQNQMNAILSKAMERRMEDGKGEAGEAGRFLFAQCQAARAEGGKVILEITCKAELKNLLREICDCCPRCKDEELPF